MKKVHLFAAAVAVVVSLSASAAYTVSGAGGAGMKLEEKAVQNFKVHFAPRAATAPKLDGKLDDACWQGVEPITDYGPCTIFGPGKKRLPKTEIYLTWDDKYLYVAAKCFEDTPENMASFRRIVTDGKRSYIVRDCIEMHIDGNNDEHTTFQCWMLATPEKHIQWNYDFGWGLLVNENYGLNANWDTANFIGDDYWCVESRYALSHFELKPQVGYIFGFEPARFRFDKQIFNADGTEASPKSGMFLGWGSQGGSHHEPNRYGKVILVEKKPASVPEGLKLAYPDLSERRILVQSGSEYAVFDCGKTSTLTYEQKARELVATTAKNAKRYCDFLNEVSNVVWSACKGSIDNTRKTLKEFDVMRTNVAARTTFDIGFLGDLEKKCGKWDTALDNGYWGLVRDTMKVEGKVRRPVALKPAANAPELGSEFADWTLRPSERTHDVVEWAKPLAGGRKKVFITVNGHGEMDAWQLAKRMDMDATIFTATGEEGSIGVTSDYFNEGFWYTPKKRQELERALKERGPFDAFVFIGTRIGTWPAELQCWLYERMLEGAQIVEKNGGGSPAFAKMTSNEELAKGSPKGFVRLVNTTSGAFDWKLEPVSLSRGPLKSQAFGKGGYSTLSTDWASAWYYAVKGSPAWPGLPEHVFQDEYGFAYLVRNVMQVLGYRNGRRAIDVGDGLAEVEADAPGDVGFRTAGESWNGQVAWTLRDLYGKVLHRKTVDAALVAGTNHCSLAIPALAAGEYYLDATLLKGGKVVDFASGRVVAKHTEKFVKCGCAPTCRQLLEVPKITEFKLIAKTLFGKDEPVCATVKVSPVAAGVFLRAEIRDVRSRVIVREDYPIGADGVVKIALKNVPEYDWTMATLDVSVCNGTRKLATKSAEFFRHRGTYDDYLVFTGSVSPGGLNGKMRMAYMANNGCDLFQKDSTAQFLSHGFDAVLRDRIPGGVPDKGGALSNPWWLKHLKERYGKHAKDLKAVNGRWVSLGDDSGEPNDFPTQKPDWVPCWADHQIKAVKALAKTLEQKGVKRANLEASAQWWRDHGINRGGSDTLEYWSFEFPMRDIAVKQLTSDKLTEAQFKEFVDSFKEVYGTVEKFNRAANLSVKDWKEITPALVKTAKWDPSPEFVNFLFWLKARYGNDIAKLNAVWKTNEKDFPSIPRSRIDEQLAAGVYAPSIDMQTFLEDAFVGQAKAIAEGIHGVDPTIGLGFGASTLGNTFCEAIKHLDSVCPYAGSFDIELLRGQKHMFIGECIGIYGGRNVPETLRRKQVWHGLLTGCNFGWFWDSCFNNADNSIDARKFGAMFETYREIRRGPAQMLLRSRRENYGVRLFVSRDAGHMGPILKDMSTHGQSLGALGSLVSSLGLQFDSITAEQVSKGALAREGVKLLLLPYAQILRTGEADAIRAFVKAGGTVVADARVGLFDEHGAPYAKPILDDVLGVVTGPAAKPVLCDLKVKVKGEGEGALLAGAMVDTSVKATTAKVLAQCEKGSAFFVNDFGKGHAVLINFNLAVIPFLDGRNELGGVRDTLVEIMALAGLTAPARMVGTDGKVITGTEFTRYVRGNEIYLGVEKTGHAYEKFPMKAFVELDKKYWVYDVRAGKKVGFTDKIPMDLEGLDVGLYSLLPVEAKALTLDIPSTVRPGTALKASAALDGSGATRIFRWELIPEGGYSMEEFMPYPWRVRDAKDGKGATAWAIGYGEKPGTKFTAVVTDVETGLTASRVVTVAE